MTKRRTRCFRWRGPRFRPVGWRRAAGRRSPSASSPFFARRQTPKSHKKSPLPCGRGDLVFQQLGLAGAAEDVAQLVTDKLLDVGTGGLQVLAGIELVGVLRHELADGAGHGQTQVGVNVDLADSHGRSLTQHLLRHALCAQCGVHTSPAHWVVRS